MYAKIYSAIVVGVDGVGVTVEADITSGLPQISVVGLPDSAVRESVERVRSAIRNSGFKYPLERITINLAPAALRKQGSGLDLAIAAGLLQASNQLQHHFDHTLFVGELSLDGHVRPIQGVLALLQYAKQAGFQKVILPKENEREADLISELQLCPITHLNELNELNFRSSQPNHSLYTRLNSKETIDLADVIGQYEAKRALLVAAAGRHNIIVCGPPGVGKTMLMRRLPTLLPPLDETKAIEVMKIYSVAGKLLGAAPHLHCEPPFRAPHHSISTAGLIGGGSFPKPGEITLAHHGVLFLDELPEFSRQVLELLRQPLEEHIVTLSRAQSHVTFPASFMLAASYNPCPCGYFGFSSDGQQCSCSQVMIHRYRAKLSGPLLDRIDIQLDMAKPKTLNDSGQDEQYRSSKLREKVMLAVERQQQRYQHESFSFNSQLPPSALGKYAPIPKQAAVLLDHAFTKLGLSMRGYERIIKIARTIADIEGAEQIATEHVAEAVQYRKLDILEKK